VVYKDKEDIKSLDHWQHDLGLEEKTSISSSGWLSQDKGNMHMYTGKPKRGILESFG